MVLVVGYAALGNPWLIIFGFFFPSGSGGLLAGRRKTVASVKMQPKAVPISGIAPVLRQTKQNTCSALLTSVSRRPSRPLDAADGPFNHRGHRGTEVTENSNRQIKILLMTMDCLVFLCELGVSVFSVLVFVLWTVLCQGCSFWLPAMPRWVTRGQYSLARSKKCRNKLRK